MLRLRYCSIEWTAAGARIAFPDGREVSAWPHPKDSHYHVVSHRCGYGDNLLAYCREHELAHVVIAQEFRDAPSCVLNAMAHESQPDQGMALLEEIAAQVLQRWARASERPILAGCDWDGLKAKFLDYSARLDAEVTA